VNSSLFKVCVLLVLVGCAAWVTLHFSGTNLETELIGDRRTTGGDALHLVLGFATVYVAYATFRSRAR
jgi:uncharacterized membrane protein YuzA (DUF378 family)